MYEAASGKWQVLLSASGYAAATLSGFGGAGYTARATDYDGDGKADPAVYEGATGNWYVKLSRSGYVTASLLGFGGPASDALAADFDGDGLADPTIYEEATGDWYVRLSGSSCGMAYKCSIASLLGFDGTGYREDADDFDGDGKADPLLYETATGMWYAKLSTSGYTTVSAPSGYTP